ncbi:hypothetical protein BLNAU_18970 [Blattamonas nauphoetae]|uniref:Uncharacterized protein n=1 Tax=Blattamonas nauphoetae TaxID=2049346 RepID=A0ABQ9X3E6_9EUKA|nr:hypothetical protein BLNAU_18970 [Blattamonas nauphoetae]
MPLRKVLRAAIHFGNQIEMEITSVSLPSKNLSCDDQATIVNILNPILSDEISKVVQPRFPGIEAKALLEWRNIQKALWSKHNSSKGDEARVETDTKRSCFTVRLTPTLLAQEHIEQITNVLNCEFSVNTSLGDKTGNVKVSFQFATIRLPKLVKNTVNNYTRHQSSSPCNPISVPPSISFTSGRNSSGPPSLTIYPNMSSPPFYSRCTSPPVIANFTNAEDALLQTPNVGRFPYSVSPPPQPLLSFQFSQNHDSKSAFPPLPTPNVVFRTLSISPPSQPLLSSIGSSSSSFSSSNTTESGLDRNAPTFVPRRSQQTPPSTTPINPTIPPSATTPPSPLPNHLSPSAPSSPTILPPLNPSIPSVVGDGDPFNEDWEVLVLDDGERDGFDDCWETLSDVEDDVDTLTPDDEFCEELSQIDLDFRGITFRGEDSDGREQLEGEADNESPDEFQLDHFSPFSSASNLVDDDCDDDLRDNDACGCDSQNDESDFDQLSELDDEGDEDDEIRSWSAVSI